MREIKFRAWNKNTYEMVEVMTIDFEKEEVCWIYDDYAHWEQSREWVGFEDIELMQFTGEKDKNGIEIYEGDIVNITQYLGGHPYVEIKYVVKRSKYNNNLVADSVSGDWRKAEVSMSFRSSDDYEVIGNIYENPELMI